MDDSRVEKAREQWKLATTFPELCELMALFIEGKLPFHPGCTGDSVDDETMPLVPYLAPFNRAGFLTTVSQPGERDPGYKQRAFVEGFTSHRVALRLQRLDLMSSLYVVVATPGVNAGNRMAGTAEGFRKYTEAGYVDWEDALKGFEKVCGEQAVRALKTNYYASIVDLEWGRSGYLWETIEQGLHNLEPHPVWPVGCRDHYVDQHGAAILEYENEKETHEGDES